MYRNIEIGNWVVLGVFAIVSFLFMPGRFAMGVLLGGLISIANFRWLSRDLRIVFLRHADKAKPFIIVKYYSENNTEGSLNIINQMGQIVDTRNLLIHKGDNYFTINTDQLPAGFYIVVLNADGINSQVKLLIN